MTPQQVRFALVSLRNEAMADGQQSDMLHLDAAIDCINRLRVLRNERRAALDESARLGQDLVDDSREPSDGS